MHWQTKARGNDGSVVNQNSIKERVPAVNNRKGLEERIGLCDRVPPSSVREIG